MDDSLLLGDKGSLNFLSALVKYKVDFMIAGASAALLQGVPLTTQDIDLWFKNSSEDKVKLALEEVNGIYVPPFMHNGATFAGESVKLFDILFNPQGLENFEKEYKNALAIKLGKTTLPVLPLNRVIKSKRAAGREKDKATLPVIENAYEVIKLKQAFPLWSDYAKALYKTK